MRQLEIVGDFKCNQIVKEHLTVSIGQDLNLGSLSDRLTGENKDLGSKLIQETTYGTDCGGKQDPTSQVSDLHNFPLLPHPPPLTTAALHCHQS